MKLEQAASQRRRALNQVWTAAGEYGFEPMFLAMDPEGAPDIYMNSIVGCARKWYGSQMLSHLFTAWEGDRRQAALDELAWLALESAVFQRELPHRPTLAQARVDHARDFFDQERTRSRQEWWAKNQLSYTLHTARWRSVLGRRGPVMTPYEKRLYDALTCGPDVTGEELERRILTAFSQAGLFSGTPKRRADLRIHFDGKLALLLARRAQLTRTDALTLGQATAPGEGGGQKHTLRGRLQENEAADRAYMRSCFGPSLYPPEVLAAMERTLCTDIHGGCHLWFTAGVPDPAHAPAGEARRLAQEAAAQAQRNREAFAQGSALYRNAILRLTEQIRACLQTHSLTETERSRSGRLDTARVWRAAVMEDENVFLRDVSSSRPGFSVDLLLDGSASRMHCQETLAAQGCILAESLRRCGVRVRVTSFCSLRGFTVLRVLKGYDDTGTQKIFNYFSSGWNRDGLAIRAAGELLRSAPEDKHLLLLLTDASPNDSHPIPPSDGFPFRREYADKAAVSDTAQEVRALRRRGIRVGAIFMGSKYGFPNAQTIYLNGLTRIQTMDQLASAAGALIRQEVQAMDEERPE